MGSLSLRQFVFPWGRLYFLLEGPLFQFNWPGGQTPLTEYISSKAAEQHRL
jgi:hypothetical protein